MALTDAQKADIRLYCGWSARFTQNDPLETAIGFLDDAAEAATSAQVVAITTACKDVDASLLAAHARLKASKVGSIELNGSELARLRGEGRRLTGRLCTILGVARGSDVFGPSGPSMGVGNFVGK